MKQTFIAALFAVTALLSHQAHAGLIQNGSFEFSQNGSAFNLDVDNGRVANTVQKGWNVYSSILGWETYYGEGLEIHKSGLLKSSVADSKAQDLNFYAELDSHSNDPSLFNSGIFQRLSGLTAGATYELSFWYQPRSKAAGDTNSNQLNIYWFNTVYNDKRDLANQNPIQEIGKSLVADSGTVWKQYSLSFVASSKDMTIGFGAGGTGDGKGALLDNVSMNQIPAPASILLFVFGLAGIYYRKSFYRSVK